MWKHTSRRGLYSEYKLWLFFANDFRIGGNPEDYCDMYLTVRYASFCFQLQLIKFSSVDRPAYLCKHFYSIRGWTYFPPFLDYINNITKINEVFHLQVSLFFKEWIPKKGRDKLFVKYSNYSLLKLCLHFPR